MAEKNISGNQHGKSVNRDKFSAWDVTILSFKLWYQRIGFWIRPNLWMILLSLPVITAPGAIVAMYHTIAAGLRDPAETKVKPRQEMKNGFFNNYWKSLGLFCIKWLAFLVILISIIFWISQETWLLRAISIISFYGLVLWWLASGYLYPLCIDHPQESVFQVVNIALRLALKNPFSSLLFAFVNTMLLIPAIILLGPILLVIPSLQSILYLHGYWYVTDQLIPGFVDLVEYTQKYY